MNEIIKFEEGFRALPYYCSEGYVTIGYGTKLTNTKDVPLSLFTLEVDETIASAFLQRDTKKCEDYLKELFFDSNTYINYAREEVLKSMVYQLGSKGFSGFKNMIEAIRIGNWEKAAQEALESLWARQTPKRAQRHAEVLKTGKLDVYEHLFN